jgi:hypothetical protein
MQCIGVKESRGEYQGHPYHNVTLHCLGEKGDGTVSHGELVETHKVKMSLLVKLGIKPKDLVARKVRVIYNQYQSVADVEVK